MGVISKDRNQLKLYYNSNNSLGKQTYGYIESAEQSLLTIDTAKENMTPTQWSEMAEGLGVRIAELIDKENPDFHNEYGDTDLKLDTSDWLKVLEEHPEFVRRPILLNGNDFRFIEIPSEVIQFLEPDRTT